MKSFVTIKLKIRQREEVLETMKQYSKAVSYIADKGFKAGIANRYELHHLCYYDVKEKFGLPSQFIINANRVASQTLKSVKTNKGGKPVFKEFLPLPFDKRTFSFSFDKIRLTTIKGRVDVSVEVPEYYWRYLDWSSQTAQIIKTKKGLFIHVTFSRIVDDCVFDGEAVGIDVGINHVAVTSNKQFFSGGKIKSCMVKFKRLRSKLQAKGTRSSRKLLKKLGGRERRFKAWVNHNISKTIVSSCEAGTIIVMEDIKGIRRSSKGRSLNFWLHGWSFYQLQKFIEYKAVMSGVKVTKVSPYLTSQTCSRCGKVGTRSKSFFQCPHCGYSLNADLNASRNLAKHDSMPDRVSAAVNQPYIPDDDSKTIMSMGLRMSSGIINFCKAVMPRSSASTGISFT